MKYLLIPTFLATLIACGTLAARELNVRTLALVKGENLPERYVKVAEKYVALSFSYIQPSEVIETLAGEASLSLYEQVTDPEGEVSYKIAKAIKLPAGAKGVLLLGWKGVKDTRYLAIDDDFLSAKYDNWLLVNTASKELAFRIGDDNKPIKIKANGVTNYKLTAREGTGVSVVGRAKWGEKMKTFYSTYWPVRAGERGIVIFFYHKGDRIALRKITDILLKPKKKTEE